MYFQTEHLVHVHVHVLYIQCKLYTVHVHLHTISCHTSTVPQHLPWACLTIMQWASWHSSSSLLECVHASWVPEDEATVFFTAVSFDWNSTLKIVATILNWMGQNYVGINCKVRPYCTLVCVVLHVLYVHVPVHVTLFIHSISMSNVIYCTCTCMCVVWYGKSHVQVLVLYF